MIDQLASLYHQYYSQITIWYHAADALTQYSILIASGIFVFLLSMIMALSKMTK